jgi:hypothetical protein
MKKLTAKVPTFTYSHPAIANIVVLPHEQAERERFERKAVVNRMYDGMAREALMEQEAYSLGMC